MRMLTISAGLLAMTVVCMAQHQDGCMVKSATLSPKPLPSGCQIKRLNLSAKGSDFQPAQTVVRALLYEATGVTGYYLGTTHEVNEDVPLLGRACIRRIAIGYFAEDIDEDNTPSNVVNLTVTFRSWNGAECSPPGQVIASYSFTGLPDYGAWLLEADLTPPVVVDGPVYVGTIWNDDRVGWIVVDGRPGNILNDRSFDSFWVYTLNGCYWFGGTPRANFALWLWGSYNTAFRVSAGDITTTYVLDSVRATFDLGNEGFLRYRLTEMIDEPARWFSIPLSTEEGGNHQIIVDTRPSFLTTQVSFQVTTNDPCNPTVVDIPLVNGDLNGDGRVDDFDLLQILFNFGAGG